MYRTSYTREHLFAAPALPSIVHAEVGAVLGAAVKWNVDPRLLPATLRGMAEVLETGVQDRADIERIVRRH